jgi:hypothetical protein
MPKQVRWVPDRAGRLFLRAARPAGVSVGAQSPPLSIRWLSEERPDRKGARFVFRGSDMRDIARQILGDLSSELLKRGPKPQNSPTSGRDAVVACNADLTRVAYGD